MLRSLGSRCEISGKIISNDPFHTYLVTYMVLDDLWLMDLFTKRGASNSPCHVCTQTLRKLHLCRSMSWVSIFKLFWIHNIHFVCTLYDKLEETIEQKDYFCVVLLNVDDRLCDKHLKKTKGTFLLPHLLNVKHLLRE